MKSAIRNTSRRVLVTIVGALAAACGDKPAAGPPQTVASDSSGVRLVVNSGGFGGATGDAVASGTAEPTQAFARITAAALLDSGRFAVADLRLTTIAIFDSTGIELRRFGQKGREANQFQELSWIGSCNGRDLLVADHYGRQLHTYDLLGNRQRSMVIPSLTDGVEEHVESCIDGNTVLLSTRLSANELMADFAPDTMSYFAANLDSMRAANIVTVFGMMRRVIGRLGPHVHAVYLPFAEKNVHASGGGRIFLTTNTDNSWMVLSATGDTIAIFRDEAVALPRVTVEDLVSYVERARDTVLSTLDRDSLEAYVTRTGLDSLHNPVWTAIADRNTGHVLARVSDASSRDRWTWVVYDRDGARLGSIQGLPLDLELQDMADGVLLAVRPQPDKPDIVVRYRLRYPQ